MSLMQELAYSWLSEIVVLGYAVSSEEGLKAVCTIMKKKNFYSDIHQFVFSSLLEVHRRGQSISILRLSDELHAQRSIPGLTWKSYLERAVQLFFDSGMPEESIEEVKRLSLLREMLSRDFSFRPNLVTNASVLGKRNCVSAETLRYYVFLNNTVLEGECAGCIDRRVVIDLRAFNFSMPG